MFTTLTHLKTPITAGGRMGSSVVAVECEACTVTLENGETVTGDFVIGADGIHSRIRTVVLSTPQAAVLTGVVAYRILLLAERLANMGNSPLAGTLGDEILSTTLVADHDCRAIMGPGRGGELFCLVCLVPYRHKHESAAADWCVSMGSLDALLAAFNGFSAWLLEVFRRAAPDIALGLLHDLDPIPRWVRGRNIIIGDASQGDSTCFVFRVNLHLLILAYTLPLKYT
ncbi:hypothetical protein SEUCBS140593_003021 [Sporothrix eucalyptigena]|uniref:FAD-binding domain-containing protein n=1 Tax=Sporothrix eucalyptigena TaxID=1812306 RepID=A0ABP0BBC8_9PEZI